MHGLNSIETPPPSTKSDASSNSSSSQNSSNSNLIVTSTVAASTNGILAVSTATATILTSTAAVSAPTVGLISNTPTLVNSLNSVATVSNAVIVSTPQITTTPIPITIKSTPTISIAEQPPPPPPPTTKSKKPTLPGREKLLPCKDREYDPDRHCGVNDKDSGRSCTRSLTCKTHSLSLRRQVPNRSRKFDDLLLEHRAAKEAALREAGKEVKPTKKQLKQKEAELRKINNSNNNSNTNINSNSKTVVSTPPTVAALCDSQSSQSSQSTSLTPMRSTLSPALEGVLSPAMTKPMVGTVNAPQAMPGKSVMNTTAATANLNQNALSPLSIKLEPHSKPPDTNRQTSYNYQTSAVSVGGSTLLQIKNSQMTVSAMPVVGGGDNQNVIRVSNNNNMMSNPPGGESLMKSATNNRQPVFIVCDELTYSKTRPMPLAMNTFNARRLICSPLKISQQLPSSNDNSAASGDDSIKPFLSAKQFNTRKRDRTYSKMRSLLQKTPVVENLHQQHPMSQSPLQQPSRPLSAAENIVMSGSELTNGSFLAGNNRNQGIPSPVFAKMTANNKTPPRPKQKSAEQSSPLLSSLLDSGLSSSRSFNSNCVTLPISISSVPAPVFKKTPAKSLLRPKPSPITVSSGGGHIATLNNINHTGGTLTVGGGGTGTPMSTSIVRNIKPSVTATVISGSGSSQVITVSRGSVLGTRMRPSIVAGKQAATLLSNAVAGVTANQLIRAPSVVATATMVNK